MCSFRERSDSWFALGAADTESLVRSVSDEATALLSHLRITSAEPPDVERLLLRAEEQWVRHQARLGHRTRELERRNRDLAKRANCDALTGVGTRGLLERQVPLCAKHCASQGRSLAVAFIDIDGLKPINDHFGHAVGDDVLRRVAIAIRDAAGEDATVCRFGGDEFVVLLPGHDLAAAGIAADRMRIDASIEGRRGGDSNCAVTLSIGCASLQAFELSDEAIRHLVSAADSAMYTAKRSGGDAVELTTVDSTVLRQAA
jgi:diguanylate cyclase (GGDEF)-like protein